MDNIIVEDGRKAEVIEMDRDDRIFCAIKEEFDPFGSVFDRIIGWSSDAYAVTKFIGHICYPMMGTFLASKKVFQEANPERFKETELHQVPGLDEWVNDWYYNEF